LGYSVFILEVNAHKFPINTSNNHITDVLSINAFRACSIFTAKTTGNLIVTKNVYLLLVEAAAAAEQQR
jgi:hypothetical protein